MNLQKLLEKRAQVKGSMDAILKKASEEDRLVLTEDEQAEYDKLKTEYSALGDSIARVRELEAMENELEAPLTPSAGGRARPLNNPTAPYGAKEFENTGDLLKAIYQARFNGKEDQRLEYKSALSSESGESGGFMFPEYLRKDGEILQVTPEESYLASQTMHMEAGDPPDSGVEVPALEQADDMYGGIKIRWTSAERDTNIPRSDVKLRMIRFKPENAVGSKIMHNHMLRNWRSAGSYLEQLFRGAIAHAKEVVIADGSGDGQALGFLNSPALLTHNRALANKVSFDDLCQLEALVIGPSPFWRITQRLLPQIRQLKDDAGNLIYNGSAREGERPTLLGKPVHFTRRGKAVGSKGDVSLQSLKGGYLTKDGSGPLIDMSTHELFSLEQTVMKVVFNFGGSPWLKAPIKGENGVDEYSFAAALDVPS